MFNRLRALALVVTAPLLLMGCLLVPGKFVSTLDISTDRSFTFTYKGEVIGIDLANEMANSFGDMDEGDDSDDGDELDPENSAISAFFFQDEDATGDDSDEDGPFGNVTDPDSEAKYQAMAEALRKEPGFRSVDYKGEGVFDIDYAITGTLTHTFVYPYNLDAEILVPFIAIELRGTENVRVKAPAFAQNDSASTMAGGKSKTNDRLDGSFTLTTNAEIISQNNEDGATNTPDGKRSITWQATPLSKDAPLAVLKLAPLAR